MLRISLATYSIIRNLCTTTGSGQSTLAKMFYAVKRGRNTGVYNTWEECKSQVDRFPAARYKKFATEGDAWDFVQDTEATRGPQADDWALQHSSSSSSAGSFSSSAGSSSSSSAGSSRYPARPSYRAKRPHNPSQSSYGQEQPSAKRTKLIEIDSLPSFNNENLNRMGDYSVVYTDGCCSRNGRLKARAGLGVYWGPNNPLNVAERLDGRQTNQRAEIQAACKAIETAKAQNISKLVLYTDSMFTINGITKWIHSWKQNGWRLSTGQNVINREDFEKLDKLTEGIEIKWMHIPGHAGFSGNEAADKLARDGARLPGKE
uniref:Ribonuclease H1 n=1 Tax=Leptobrachium leishanense TaxID=445787 RepID=A0A8C5QKD1_9ANUR